MLSPTLHILEVAQKAATQHNKLLCHLVLQAQHLESAEARLDPHKLLIRADVSLQLL